MTAASQVGFITMAYGGQRYIDQAISLARSVKLHMPGQKIALVTDRTARIEPFDEQIRMDDFKLAGTVLKRKMYEYSPFDETLFIDSDCLVTRDCSEQIEAIRRWDFSPVVNTYLVAGDRDLWLRDVGEAVARVGGANFPKFNGGVYFFRKSETAAKVFAGGEEMLARQEELGILDFDKAGPGEETLLGLAMAQLGITDLYDDEGKLMRTPLNATGPILLDIFAGECAFEKNGTRVEPAIVHFCGEWIDHPAYVIACRELAKGARLPALERARIEGAYKARRLGAKVARRLGG